MLAVVLGVWLALDCRRRDSYFDWDRGTFRGQVGWFTREFSFDQFQDLLLQTPAPKKKLKGSDDSATTNPTDSGRIVLVVGGTKYILLETEYDRDSYSSAKSKLQSVIEKLSAALQLSWSGV